MNLDVIHHVDNPDSRQVHYRESVYRVSDQDIQPLGARIKVEVHKDRSYDFQGWARASVWTGNDWQVLITADRRQIHRMEPWEVENILLEAVAKFLGLTFDHFDTEGALFDAGYLE
jgi:hypothetical protein